MAQGPDSEAVRACPWGIAVAFAVVLAIFTLAALPLLRSSSLGAHCDNPYKFAQQASFTDAIAAGRDPLGWTQEFSGGYPELQFYPAGVPAMGSFLGRLTGGDERGYWLTLIVAWFLPGITATGALLLVGARPSTAVVGAVLVGLANYGFTGTNAGVGCGVLAVRYSVAFVVLAAGVTVRAARAPAGPRRGWLLVALTASIAAATAFHLYFLPVAAVVVLAIVVRLRASLGSGVWWVVAASVAGVLLVAPMWWGTVLLRTLAVPYRASTEADPSSFLIPFFSARRGLDWLPLLVTAGWVAALSRRRAGLARAAILGSVSPAIAGLVLVALVLDAGFDVRYLSVTRLYDGLIVWACLTAPLALELALPRRSDRRIELAVAATVIVCFLALEWPGRFPPEFGVDVDTFARTEHVDELWTQLRAGRGRIAFTANNLGTSHIAGLTWRRTGREAVNGGPTVASPMQSALLGGPHANGIEHFGDLDDNTRFLGHAWTGIGVDALSTEDLVAGLHQLGISELVVMPGLAPDDEVLAALGRVRGAFAPVGRYGRIKLFRVLGTDPARVWADRRDGSAEPTTVTVEEDRPERIVASVDSLVERTVVVRMLQSPYWSTVVDGNPVTTRSDDFRQITVRVPPGRHRIEVVAQTPPAMSTGRRVLFLAGVVVAVVAVIGGRGGFGKLGRRRMRI